jgi:predicted ArsR family transcriptional regulator
VDEAISAQAGLTYPKRLPRKRQRDHVLELVREHRDAVDAATLAAEIELHITTVRFHLDALCDEGQIVRTRLPRVGAGRPRTGYLAVEERMDYQILSEVLAGELGNSAPTRARRAERAGRKWAAHLMASQKARVENVDATSAAADDRLDRASARAAEVFRRMGFEPEIVTTTGARRAPSGRRSPQNAGERVIRLHACPIRDLARQHPDVGCAVHLGLLQGLIAESEPSRRSSTRAALSAQLEPFVKPQLCLARLVLP